MLEIFNTLAYPWQQKTMQFNSLCLVLWSHKEDKTLRSITGEICKQVCVCILSSAWFPLKDKLGNSSWNEYECYTATLLTDSMTL